MTDAYTTKAELARRFAEETDAIALGGAAPDCAEQLAAFHNWFDAECARLHDGQASLAPAASQSPDIDRR